jgi:septal ring factor EnvC (AmiA/AmiB activator)
MAGPCSPEIRRLLVPALLLAWALPCRPLAAEEETRARALLQEEARLQRIQQEIDEIRGRLEFTAAQEGSVLDALEELDLRRALLDREAGSLRREIAAAARRQEATGRQVDDLTRRLAAEERDLRAWLREVYKVGPLRYLRWVASTSSPAQVAASRRMVGALGLGEARRIEAVRADRQRLQVALIDLQGQRQALARLERDLQRKAEEVLENRRREEAVLAGLKKEKTAQKRVLLDLEQVQREIRDLIERLSRPGYRDPVPSLGFVRFRGLLDWPAQGRLAVPFGNVRHPRFSTEIRHPGVDIAADPGKEVRAVFDGRVVFSDWFKGYGQMIVIDHGDGYLSIYGYVDERLVATGQEVRQGERIAQCGARGSFDVPGLYFEIRHDGKPEDPARWLRGAPGRTLKPRPAGRPSARGSRSGN